MIQKIAPSFTSKVYITNYDKMNKQQMELVNSDDFLSEIEKLNKNNNKDTVVFTPDTYPRCPTMYMTVTQKIGNKKLTISSEFDYSDEIQETYDKAKKALAYGDCYSTVKGDLVKYIV